MKRVLEVAYPALNNSGVPAVIMGIVRELHDECKFDVLVFRSEIGIHKTEFESYGGSIFVVNCDKTSSRLRNIVEKITRPYRLYHGTKKILKENDYDVIHCHNGVDAGWCILAAKKIGVPVRIAHSHASVNPFEKEPIITRVYQTIMRVILNKNTTERIGCSQIAADNLFGKEAATKVVLNAADLSRFNQDIIHFKINSDSPTLLFVGRVTKQKNPLFLIDIFGSLQKKIPNSKFKIIGFGDMENDVKKAIEEKKLNNIFMLQHSTDVPSILADSDVFVLPSFYEGLPVVLVEAQTMGVHCFVSDTIAKESDMGLCDFMSLTLGADTWASKIYDYVMNTQYKHIPEKEIENKYSWKTIANEYREIYGIGTRK